MDKLIYPIIYVIERCFRKELHPIYQLVSILFIVIIYSGNDHSKFSDVWFFNYFPLAVLIVGMSSLAFLIKKTSSNDVITIIVSTHMPAKILSWIVAGPIIVFGFPALTYLQVLEASPANYDRIVFCGIVISYILPYLLIVLSLRHFVKKIIS